MIPDPPAPPLRRGPRPLLLHLTLAMLRSTASTAVLPSSRHGWPKSSAGRAEAERIAAALAASREATEPEFVRALLARLGREDRELIAGIAAYRRHPYRRILPDPPVLWQEGESRLLDYATARRARPTVLFVPSLVNRAHVLDLAPGHSFLRFLAAQGIRPLLLDWGWPDASARRFTLTDYIAGRFERALTSVRGPVVLAGYCMGGLLALAAALRRPERFRALALLATPWDFHAPDPAPAQALARLLPLFAPALAFDSTLPIDLLQVLFALLDPFAVSAKYRSFARLDPAGSRAELFVALEDWLNDGIPLAAPVAREALADWYGGNLPGRGLWRVAGMAVEPSGLRMPAFVAVPARDRIVPPESARPAAFAIPGAVLHEPRAGHIGMVAGSTAESALWRPFADWLAGL